MWRNLGRPKTIPYPRTFELRREGKSSDGVIKRMNKHDNTSVESAGF